MTRRVQTLTWVGLFAAPFAFAFEHIAGWLMSEGNCSPAHPVHFDFTATVAVITAVSALAAAGGIAASVTAYRAVAGTDNDAAPPVGRMWILSICGIVVSSLLFILILLGGSGALLLGHCMES